MLSFVCCSFALVFSLVWDSICFCMHFHRKSSNILFKMIRFSLYLRILEKLWINFLEAFSLVWSKQSLFRIKHYCALQWSQLKSLLLLSTLLIGNLTNRNCYFGLCFSIFFLVLLTICFFFWHLFSKIKTKNGEFSLHIFLLKLNWW